MCTPWVLLALVVQLLAPARSVPVVGGGGSDGVDWLIVDQSAGGQHQSSGAKLPPLPPSLVRNWKTLAVLAEWTAHENYVVVDVMYSNPRMVDRFDGHTIEELHAFLSTDRMLEHRGTYSEKVTVIVQRKLEDELVSDKDMASRVHCARDATVGRHHTPRPPPVAGCAGGASSSTEAEGGAGIPAELKKVLHSYMASSLSTASGGAGSSTLAALSSARGAGKSTSTLPSSAKAKGLNKKSAIAAKREAQVLASKTMSGEDEHGHHLESKHALKPKNLGKKKVEERLRMLSCWKLNQACQPANPPHEFPIAIYVSSDNTYSLEAATTLVTEEVHEHLQEAGCPMHLVRFSCQLVKRDGHAVEAVGDRAVAPRGSTKTWVRIKFTRGLEWALAQDDDEDDEQLQMAMAASMAADVGMGAEDEDAFEETDAVCNVENALSCCVCHEFATEEKPLLLNKNCGCVATCGSCVDKLIKHGEAKCCLCLKPDPFMDFTKVRFAWAKGTLADPTVQRKVAQQTMGEDSPAPASSGGGSSSGGSSSRDNERDDEHEASPTAGVATSPSLQPLRADQCPKLLSDYELMSVVNRAKDGCLVSKHIMESQVKILKDIESAKAGRDGRDDQVATSVSVDEDDDAGGGGGSTSIGAGSMVLTTVGSGAIEAAAAVLMPHELGQGHYHSQGVPMPPPTAEEEEEEAGGNSLPPLPPPPPEEEEEEEAGGEEEKAPDLTPSAEVAQLLPSQPSQPSSSDGKPSTLRKSASVRLMQMPNHFAMKGGRKPSVVPQKKAVVPSKDGGGFRQPRQAVAVPSGRGTPRSSAAPTGTGTPRSSSGAGSSSSRTPRRGPRYSDSSFGPHGGREVAGPQAADDDCHCDAENAENAENAEDADDDADDDRVKRKRKRH